MSNLPPNQMIPPFKGLPTKQADLSPPITANGTYEMFTIPGKEYFIEITGDFGGCAVELMSTQGASIRIFSGNDSYVFTATDKTTSLVVNGSSGSTDIVVNMGRALL
jgi:hypothetical protein